MTDPESPAFPRATPLDNEVESRGLTKREYFAGIAMEAALTRAGGTCRVDDIAEFSLEMADALIIRLSK